MKPGHMFARLAASALLALGLLAGCATAPQRPAQIAQGDYAYCKQYLSWLIDSEMKKNRITGLSIALVDDQRVVWAQGFGFADQERGIHAGAETVYRVGSISKLFTATATMQLAEQGKIDIDRPLAAYLPGFAIKTRFADAGPITPRNIMTHHSGLPGDRAKGMWSMHPASYTSLASELHDEYVANPPDRLFAYSNLGVTLLGDAVGRISGQGFAVYADQALLQPMGMSHSSFTDVAEAPLMARAYNGGSPAQEFGLRDVPAGGLNTNVLDLGRFLSMVFAGGRSGEHQILRPETLAEMLRPQNTGVPLDFDFRIGLGWFLDPDGEGPKDSGPVAAHGGATYNFRSHLEILPQHKLGVIVLSNSATAGATVQRVATEAIRLALEAKNGVQQAPAPPPADRPAPKPVQLRAELAQSLAGYYATNFGLVKVSNDGGRLTTTVAGRKLQLLPYEDGLWRPRLLWLGFIPIGGANAGGLGFSLSHVDGHDVLVGTRNGRSSLMGEKVTPYALSAELRRYLGEYEPVPADAGEAPTLKKVTAKYEDGFVVAEVTEGVTGSNIRHILAPVSDSEAVLLGLGRGLGETVRLVRVGDEEHVFVSGLELRRGPTPTQ